MQKSMIMTGAEPFYFPGDHTGCLLIHGFTGTPREMRGMGDFLRVKGYTIYGVRLAGHATNISDLVRTKWQDWLLSVEDGINLLKNSCTQIYTIGLSMGGILSLVALNRYKVDAAIAMSTPYNLPDDWRLKFSRSLSGIYPYVKKGPSDLKNSEARNTHLDYPVYPTRAIAELNDLTAELHRVIPKITKPVLLIHSKADNISYQNSVSIYENIASPDKQLLLLENSGHVITEDIERIKVFEKANEFIIHINKTLVQEN